MAARNAGHDIESGDEWLITLDCEEFAGRSCDRLPAEAGIHAPMKGGSEKAFDESMPPVGIAGPLAERHAGLKECESERFGYVADRNHVDGSVMTRELL